MAIHLRFTCLIAACSAAPGIDADVNRLFGASDGPGRADVDFTGERSGYG